jgi:beta-galactosidase GanA
LELFAVYGDQMFLAAHYYRPPLPDRKLWAADFAKMRKSGIDTVQLWCIWGWIESQPGQFRFDDYDELFSLAAKNGLGVVLRRRDKIT